MKLYSAPYNLGSGKPSEPPEYFEQEEETFVCPECGSGNMEPVDEHRECDACGWDDREDR